MEMAIVDSSNKDNLLNNRPAIQKSLNNITSKINYHKKSMI